eukprot:7464-Heterococcus_DN1.PRE.1
MTECIALDRACITAAPQTLTDSAASVRRLDKNSAASQHNRASKVHTSLQYQQPATDAVVIAYHSPEPLIATVYKRSIVIMWHRY